jgi:hypothetical protein
MKMTSRMRMRRSLRRFVRRSESMLPRFAVGESGKTS